MIKRIFLFLALVSTLFPVVYAGENLLEIPDVKTSPGVPFDLPVILRNQDPVTAIELHIRDNYSGWNLLSSECLRTDRLTDTHVATLSNDGDILRVLVYSASNTPINGSSGTVISIPLQTSYYAQEGESYPFEIMECLLVRPDGKDILTSYISGSLTIEETPDLLPDNIALSSASIVPGEQVEVSWEVSNIGRHSTYSGFREIFYITDGESSCYIGESRYDDLLPAGATVSRRDVLSIPSFPGMDGDVHIRLTVNPYSDCGESITAQGNNTVKSHSTYNLVNRLQLRMPYEITEGNEEDWATVTRSGNVGQPLSVYLTNVEKDSRLNFPAELIIPAYSSSGNFPISLIPDTDYQSDTTLSLTVSAPDCMSAHASFIALDGAVPEFTLTETSDDFMEGTSQAFTLTRNVSPTTDIEVNIDCDMRQLFRFPSTVTFPAHQTSITFEVEAINDRTISVNRPVMFQASAPGYESGRTYITLIDDDMPDISLSFAPAKVAEDAGISAVLATVRRISGSDDALVIRISSDYSNEVFLPSQLNLAAGETEITFPIGVVDNGNVDGDRNVTVTASVYSSECSCWASETGRGYVDASFTITDNDGPALSITGPSTLLEGKEIEMVVSRNTSTDSPLTVNLSYDGPANLSLPSAIIIPGGEESVPFTLSAPSNGTEDDTTLISVYAKSAGFSEGSCRIMVTDATLPDAVIPEFTSETTDCVPGQIINLIIKVRNDGVTTLPAKVPVKINLSDGTSLSAYTMGSIAPGASEKVTKTITLPERTGRYTLQATINPDHTVKELLAANNSSSPISINIAADIKADIVFNADRYNVGDKINFKGTVTRGIKPGGEIDVCFLNDGLKTSTRVRLDEHGDFQGEYIPYSGRYGKYTVGLSYPGDSPSDLDAASFDYVGLIPSEQFGKEEVMEGDSFIHTMRLKNSCSFPLTGLTVEYSSLPAEILRIELPESVEADETIDLSIVSTALLPSPGKDWLTLPLTVRSSEGAKLDYTLYYYAHSLKGNLSLSENNISTTMAKGTQRLYNITLTNTARGETGEISIDLPRVNWLSLASPATIPSLKEGESTEIILRLSPTEDLQLNNTVNATVAANASNAKGSSINIKAEAVSDTKGTLVFDVCDEYTYNTAEAPHVEGATVTVMHPVTRKVLHTLTTGSDGIASIEIPEGYYFVSVTEPKHSGFEGMLLVDPEKETRKTVNLGVEGVSIDIRYEQTEIEDVYDIVTTVKYETNVPAPVVEVILPQFVEIESLAPGESLMFTAVMTNKGLITAQDTRLQIPELDDPDYSISIIGENGFDLLPGTSRTVPIMVTRSASGGPSSVKEMKRTARSGGGNCRMETFVFYDSYCGPDKKIHTQRYEIQIRVCGGIPVADPGHSGWGGGGGSWGGGWGSVGSPGFSSSTTQSDSKMNEIVDKFESFVCDPCTNGVMNALANCNNFDPDHPIQSIIKRIPIIGDVVGCGFDLYNCSKDEGNKWWSKCGKDVFGCALMACEKIGGVLVKVGAGTTATGAGAAPGVTMAGVGGVMTAVCKILSEGKDKLECLDGLANACPKDKDKKNVRAANDEEDYSRYPSYLGQYLEKLDHVITGRKAIHEYYEEVIGYEQMFEATTSELSQLFEAIANVPDEELLDAEELMEYIPECVEEEVFRMFINRQNNSILKIQGKDYSGETIDFDRLLTLAQIAEDTKQYALSLGYSSVEEMMTASQIELENGYNDKSGSVCSSVTLAIEQRMTMTRQAIRGILTVVNGHESETLTDFKTYLNVYDEDGELVGADRLQIAVENLEGFNGEKSLDAGWNLAHDSEGIAKILFIPTKKAAPERETLYTFSGQVTYLDPFSGLVTTRQLTPTTMSIYPSPELYLTYFMERDVMGDDPLTTNIIESSVPSEFTLVIANKGKGDAKNVAMTTAQPKIVDNEKGLALDMRIVGSTLNGEAVAMTPDEKVVNNFGTIPAGSSSYAQWLIESNLLGHFTSYDVSVTHVTSYDNPDLSLVDGAEIHELIQGMSLPDDEMQDAKAVRAFVVNDIVDAQDKPDRIFFSDGRPDEAVNTNADINLVIDGLTGLLTVNPALGGWQYFSVPDATYGMARLVKIVRESDGKEIPVDNFRQTDRTLRDGHDPVYEYLFKGCVNTERNETYRLAFEETELTPLEVVAWDNIPDDGVLAVKPVDVVGIRFNLPVNQETLSTENLKLIREGEKVDTPDIAFVQTDDPYAYEIQLGSHTAANGYYQLMIDLSKTYTVDGQRGAGWARCGWVMLADGIVTLDVEVQPANSGKIEGYKSSVTPGTDESLKAIANDGYEFLAWYEGDNVISTNASLEYTMDKDTRLVARFTPVNRTLAVSLSDELGGTLTGMTSGLYPDGTRISLNVEVTDGWEFDGWINTADNSVVSSKSEYTFDISSDLSLMASVQKVQSGLPAKHEIYLREGWRWLSFPLIHEDFDNLPAFLSQIFHGFESITDYASELHKEGFSYIGDMESLCHKAGYKLFVSSPISMYLEGSQFDGSDLTVTLEKGINLIGAPLGKVTPVSEALGGLQATEGDALISQESMTVYNGKDWVGPLVVLSPGEAYLYVANERASFNWPLQKNEGTSTLPPTNYGFKVSPEEVYTVYTAVHPDAMGLTIRVESKEPAKYGDYRLLAFDDETGECIGMSEECDGLHFIIVHGDNKAGSRFRISAFSSEKMKFVYESDSFTFEEGLLGTVNQPVLLTIGELTGMALNSADLKVYPNPVKDTLHISGIDDVEAEVTIIDHDGRIHYRHHGLEYNTSINVSGLANGLYRMIIRSQSKTNVTTIIKN